MASNKTSTLRVRIKQLDDWFSRTSHLITSGWQGKILTALLILLSLTVIAGILIRNWDVIQNFDWQIRPVWLIFILFFFLLDLFIATWVWHLIVARLANYNNFRRSAKICWQANLARRIPTPVWYIAGRAVMYEREGVSKLTTSLLSTLELIFFFLSGLVTTLLVLPFWIIPKEMENQINQIWLLAFLFPLGILFVHPKLLKKLWMRLRPETPLQELKWRDTLIWLLYYILTWVIGAFVIFGVMNFLHPVAFSNIIALIGIWSLAGSLSLAGALTISVIGIREISLVFLLAALVPMPVALIVAVLIRIVWLLGEMLSVLIAWKL